MAIMDRLEDLLELAKETGYEVGTVDEIEVLREKIRAADKVLEGLQREHQKLTGQRYRWFK